jgi:hypothetical protein
MTSKSRLEIVDSLKSVGGFHGVRAYSRVFRALSLPLYYPGPPGGEMNDAPVYSWRDCFVISLLGSDTFSCGVVRGTVYPTPCIGLRLTAICRGDRAYL